MPAHGARGIEWRSMSRQRTRRRAGVATEMSVDELRVVTETVIGVPREVMATKSSSRRRAFFVYDLSGIKEKPCEKSQGFVVSFLLSRIKFGKG